MERRICYRPKGILGQILSGGLDMDAGPIILELSPSGTAFFAGSSIFFNDSIVRKGILKTAEIAGHTIKMGNKRHYLLANVALVGEAIMLAMGPNHKHHS